MYFIKSLMEHFLFLLAQSETIISQSLFRCLLLLQVMACGALPTLVKIFYHTVSHSATLLPLECREDKTLTSPMQLGTKTMHYVTQQSVIFIHTIIGPEGLPN